MTITPLDIAVVLVMILFPSYVYVLARLAAERARSEHHRELSQQYSAAYIEIFVQLYALQKYYKMKGTNSSNDH